MTFLRDTVIVATIAGSILTAVAIVAVEILYPYV